ncbi:hypothetical protein [Brevundimonas sp. FT23028]|uniref:hypothetical protein n=1 Tax=Brevundimonas sp. FT23028 TaxID=3393748 RepID=UPI003B586C53
MPTENERKFVLADPAAVLAVWPREAWDDVRQGYLPGDARIRRRMRDGRPSDSFTYKIDAGGRLVEIETALETRDFDDLWPLTTRRIHKLRRAVTDAHGLAWDIDLFLDSDGRFYLAMAECEMPEDMEQPPEILPELAPLIRYVVPRERQTEFVNSRLADPAYVASLAL